jgi:hypothetical protein
MQKRIRIVSIVIILIVLFISIIFNNNTNNKHTFKKDGILYDIKIK